MSDSTKKLPKGGSLDPQSNQPLLGQNCLPFGLDGADGPVAPDVQADGRAAPDGQGDGPTRPMADEAGPPEGRGKADPYDLDSLRLSQDFASAVGVKRLTKTIPVKKPSKEWFVRTHPTVSAPDGRLRVERGSGDLPGGSRVEGGAGVGDDVLPPVAGLVRQPTRCAVPLADPAPRSRRPDR